MNALAVSASTYIRRAFVGPTALWIVALGGVVAAAGLVYATGGVGAPGATTS